MFPFEAFAPVAAILGVLTIGGWIFTTWLRMKVSRAVPTRSQITSIPV